MTDIDRQSSARPKSSRRRRWEVRSRESFETSLALALESPNDDYYKGYKSERPKSSRSVHKRKSKLKKEETFHSENNSDIVSAKLSALLNDANDKPNSDEDSSHSKLGDSEENLIKSELKTYFDPNVNDAIPSAPPFNPEFINKTPKKKVSVKVTPVHSDINTITSRITEQLKQLSEDVVDGKVMPNKSIIPAVAVSGLLLGPSSSTFNGNVSTIYCEQLNNFVMANENQFLHYQNEHLQNNVKNSRKSHAIFLQTNFRTFSVLCQGLLSGLTLAHCLMIFFLQDGMDVLLQKNGMEYTFFTLIYFLSTICLISAFDRCDLAGLGIFSGHGIRIPWVTLFYSIAMMLNLIMIKAEDFITNFEVQKIHNEKDSILYWWKFMCLGQTIFSLLAWFVLVLDPHADALKIRISELPDE